MKDTKEGDSNLLDNSLIVYGSGLSDGNVHTHDQLPTLLAGRGGGFINPGPPHHLSARNAGGESLRDDARARGRAPRACRRHHWRARGPYVQLVACRRIHGRAPIGVVYNTSMTRARTRRWRSPPCIRMEGKTRIAAWARFAWWARASNAADLLRHRRADVLLRRCRATATRRCRSAWPHEHGAPDPPMVKTAVERRMKRLAAIPCDFQSVPTPPRPRRCCATASSSTPNRWWCSARPRRIWQSRSILLGTKDLYKERVKRLVIVDTGTPYKDAAALRKVVAEWPTPVFYCAERSRRRAAFSRRGSSTKISPGRRRTRWSTRIRRTSRCRTTRRFTTSRPRTMQCIPNPASSRLSAAGNIDGRR